MGPSRSLFNYYDVLRGADAFLNGQIRFQTLSTFRNWEEQGVRGDKNEGVAFFAPSDGPDLRRRQRLQSTPRGRRPSPQGS